MSTARRETASRKARLHLLDADEPSPVTIERPAAMSDFVLTCDHASPRIPKVLGTLGLSHTELSSHIAWDIGAARVAQLLSERLEATLTMQNYSRLVIDCNRLPAAVDSIPGRSEWVDIAGNEHLDAAAIEVRRAEIFTPYHDALHALLEQRKRDGRKTLLLAVHSFTPTYLNVSRPWSVGLMYRKDARLAQALLPLLRKDKRMEVGDNQPYGIADVDYGLPVYGESRGLPHVGLEIRNDLIADEAGQKTWAGRLASLLKQASDLISG
ncbi:N-formylglutamate amidohydrolase [Povalibacter sp.]|uniref:N-formylglutamate amidohydrolase n=1 Tax=Povalibacter sp. TaxID=1962978 RepID=UPI002F40BD8D